MQKPYVFISYSTIDQEHANTVNTVLKENGINTWIATEDIHGGESFATEITNGIRNCDAFVFVLSKNSDNSPHCGNELSLAFSGRKKIIPFRLHEFEISESNTYFLQQAQWIDYFTDENFACEELVRQIKAYLSLEKTEFAPVKITIPHAVNSQADNFIVRAELALEDGDYEIAKKFINDALNVNATNAKAYLVMLLCDLRLSKKQELSSVDVDFSSNPNYKKALRFADEEMREFLEKAQKDCVGRLGSERVQQEKLKSEHKEIGQRENGLKKEENAKNIEKLEQKRAELALAQNFVSLGLNHSLVLKSDGTVVTFGDNEYGQLNTQSWKDIVAVSAGGYHSLGLKSNGTVVAVGYNRYGQGNVGSWKNIVAISAGDYHTLGLKSDGVVVSVGSDENGQCAVQNWRDIVAVSAGEGHSLGLKSDGSVVAVGSNGNGQCNVQSWKDIVAISAGGNHSLGLKKDGTVVAVGSDVNGQCGVEDWADIVAVSAGEGFSLGLKSDGSVVAVGYNRYGQCEAQSWKDTVAICAGEGFALGVKMDGSVAAVGDNRYGQCDVGGCEVFNDFKNLEKEIEELRQERLEKEKIKRERIERDKQEKMEKYRAQGLCQYCGGKLKGLFSKTCAECGRKKDY